MRDDPLADAAALLAGNFSSRHDQLPQRAREPIESWRRIIAKTQGEKRSNWQQACRELLALAKLKFPNDAPTRNAINDEILAMSRDAGIDGDEAQQFMEAKPVPRVDRTRQANGHAAIDEPPPVKSAADFGLPNDDAPSVVDLPTHDAPAARKFPLLPFDQIQVNTERRGYLVKGLLASTGLAVVWGPPKCGKSFWAVDVGMHIALGWEYRGRRVQQAPVVYIALEGQHGLPARLEAFRRHHDVTEAPFYLILVRLDLIADVGVLVTEIKAQIGAVMPGVVFIDTLNRSLVGSESKDEDMARYLGAADRLAGELGAAVVVVHHCGIDASRPRGHTSLTGSVESQLAVKRGEAGEVVVTVEYAKDFAEGAEVFSRLEPVMVGTDPDGDDITTLVVLPADRAAQRSAPQVKVKGIARLALDALREAINDTGEIGPTSSRIPANIRTIPVVRWRDQFEATTVNSDKKPDSQRRAFDRAAERLQAINIIGVWKDRVWIVGQVGQ